MPCRDALGKLKAAIGDDSATSVSLGSRVGPQAAGGDATGGDAADVVPAETDASPPHTLPAGQCLPVALLCSLYNHIVCCHGIVLLHCTCCASRRHLISLRNTCLVRQ